MSGQPARIVSGDEWTTTVDAHTPPASQAQREPEANEMPCPVCGALMPDLKGGKATICPNCGFKDSCCF